MNRESLISSWLHDLQTHLPSTTIDYPNYYASEPAQLITTSTPLSFTVGSGHQILTSLLPLCLNTKSELLIVTCFIAPSPSLNTLYNLLTQLSQNALSRKQRIRVRVCFSSISLWQKLSQTASLDGKVWVPAEWPRLGLPPEERLEGLDLVVKSVFIRPFSVMHPKFMVIDRKTAVVLSANISWEEWFEGAIALEGKVCDGLIKFWEEVWERSGGQLPPLPGAIGDEPQSGYQVGGCAGLDEHLGFINRSTFPSLTVNSQSPTTIPTIPTIILPSPHHTNPSFRPFSFSPNQPPRTPLNLFLLQLFIVATSNVTIVTPNLTSEPVVSSILSALSRGVNAHIITSRRLMILEQLVTAFTVTELEIWKLRRRYSALLNSYERQKSANIEARPIQPGRLTVGFFKEGNRASESGQGTHLVKTHLKMVIVDEEVTVLGSGNMDRASWWTSQELGIAFFGRELARDVWNCVEGGLEGRVDYIS